MRGPWPPRWLGAPLDDVLSFAIFIIFIPTVLCTADAELNNLQLNPCRSLQLLLYNYI